MRRSTLAGVVVSLLLHCLALLWFWPDLMRLRELPSQPSPGRITARLSLPSEPKPAPAPSAPEPPVAAPEPRPRPRPQKPEPAQRGTPPVIARRAPSPQRPLAPPQDRPLPQPFPQPPPDTSPETDMMAALNKKRAQRDAAEEKYRSERSGNQLPNPDDLAMARIKKNLEVRPDKNGIFAVRDVGVREAVVVFRGWRGNDRRSAIGEEFKVDAGVGGDVETAVIKQVIWVIRRDYQGDFDWESYRLGKVVTLSARQKDTPQLIAFLRKELFTNY